MGGNIFKLTHEVKRLPRHEYFTLVEEVTQLVKGVLGDSSVDLHVVRAMHEKQDFGDMDVLVNTSSPEVVNLLRTYLEEYYPTQQNGTVLSFLYKSFQIDLIFIPEESYAYAQDYFAWNDVGNMVGRLSKKFGLKHGHLGLTYIQRKGDVRVEEFVLSTDYTTVLNILELDVEHFKRGFNNPVEMFNWLADSPYFDPEIFKFENLNNINRVRDRKRVVYRGLVDWCLTEYIPRPNAKKPPEKEKREEFVLNTFPFISRKVFLNKLNISIDLAVSASFNGRLIMALIPELSGKQLGEFITQYKATIPFFKMFVLNSTKEELEQSILTFYKGTFKE